MRRRTWSLSLVALALIATPRLATAAVSLSASAADPSVGASDQYNLVDTETIPGGTTPGGGTYNSQSYSDNGGPPGQTFTTPNTAAGYRLTAVSFKGTGDAGGGSLAGEWGIRVSSVSGTALTPLGTATDIVGPGGATPNTDWLTWTFSAGDVLTLSPGSQYAVDVYSESGWWGTGGALDGAYAGGTAFNSAGVARGFADATTGNLANHGYDRTFHVALTPVPEPAGCVIVFCGIAGLLAARRRR
jgi:hypothetical protein